LYPPTATLFPVGARGIEPRLSCSQGTRIDHLPRRRFVRSTGRRTRTFIVPGSKPGAIPLGDPRIVLSSGQRSAGQGSGRRTRTSITCSRGKRPTVSRSPRVSCGSRTRLSRLGTRCLPTRPRTLVSGRRGSRTLKACARPLSRQVPSPVGSPFRQAAVAGLEPARFRLTAGCATIAPHRNTVSEAGLEPAFSSVRGSRPLQTGPLAVFGLPSPVGGEGSGVRGMSHPSVRTGGLEPPLSSFPRWRPLPTGPRPEIAEHQAGIEPALPPWHGGRLPLHHRCCCHCRIVKDRLEPVPPVGIEPTTSPLRAGCSAS
jgi:hypothetical protein